MRNFTNQEIKFLVESGFLMPLGKKISKNHYPSKKPRKEYPVGYPLLIDKKSFINQNSNFPTCFLQKYDFLNQEDEPNFSNFYLLPYGIQDMIDFNVDNHTLTKKLKEWINLSEIFILENTTEEQEQQLEIELLKLFREMYFLYLVDRKIVLSPVEKIFFELDDQGQTYRTILNKDFPKAFEDINHSSAPLLSSIIHTTDDLIHFENSVIENPSIANDFCSIRSGMLYLWADLLTYKSLNGSYHIESPFFHQFKDSLFRLHYNSISPDVTINVLEWLTYYDFSLLKDIFINILFNSNKIKLNTYIEDKLKLHNSLPDISPQLVLEKNHCIIYQENFSFNFGLIKNHVNNSLFAGESLIAIVEKAFLKDEKDCYRINYKRSATENIIYFSIEALSQSILHNLVSKLLVYIQVVLSPEFLDYDMITLLCKYGENSPIRKLHENDTNVMEKFLNVKEKTFLRNKLEKKLVPKKSTEKVKKI